MNRTPPPSRLRAALTIAATATGSFALAVACSHSAPPPKEPATLSNRAEPEGMIGGDQYGILGAMYGGGAFASLTGTGDFSSGFGDDDNIWGGLLGNEAGEMYGGFGFGSAGFGYGGFGGIGGDVYGYGGGGWGTIGTGRYGTIGHGSGTGTSSGYGVLSTASVPSVKIGAATTTGDLDKDIIRRYIRRNLAKIKYCYERELVDDSTLEGKVKTEFSILPDGSTGSVTASGVHPDVESCIVGVLETILFPKPQGGGSVQVVYPFIFRSVEDTPSTAPAGP
jgi:hypothetical protein